MDYGRRKLTGVIVEDRGPLGVGGRWIYGVEVPLDPFEPMTTEVPEDELEVVADNGAAAPLDKKKVIEFLKYGLGSNLRSGMTRAKDLPRVWLCRDTLGNVTYTFVAERGISGGQPVPRAAVRWGEIVAGKRDEVLSYLESFGLNRKEAEAVVSEVGTSR